MKKSNKKNKITGNAKCWQECMFFFSILHVQCNSYFIALTILETKRFGQAWLKFEKNIELIFLFIFNKIDERERGR